MHFATLPSMSCSLILAKKLAHYEGLYAVCCQRLTGPKRSERTPYTTLMSETAAGLCYGD